MSQAGVVPTEASQRQVIDSPSYGAAFFNWIYLLAMRAWGHAILALILTMMFWPAAWVVYGIFGKRIAWGSRRWRDFDDFLACQRAWTRAAVIWTAVIAALILLSGGLRMLLLPSLHFTVPAPHRAPGPSI